MKKEEYVKKMSALIIKQKEIELREKALELEYLKLEYNKLEEQEKLKVETKQEPPKE